MIELTREPVRVDRVLEAVAARGAGAVVHFLGTVRDHNVGRRVLHLEYEGYEPMAQRELQALADVARLRWPLTGVAIVHRLGRMEIGDVSVAIAVASAHRGVAFEACRWLIDALKKNVPIWKKEFFEGGEVWIEGEGAPKP